MPSPMPSTGAGTAGPTGGFRSSAGATPTPWPMLRARLRMAALPWWAVAVIVLAGCSSLPAAPDAPGAQTPVAAPDYRIGPMDTLQIVVWQSPETSAEVIVRPDGRISTPLVEDMPAAGKTPSELANNLEGALSRYIQDPLVAVIVDGFSGPFDQQVRVVGEAAKPRAIPYRADMTVLDVMIEAGGLTEYAAGNRSVLARRGTAGQTSYGVRIDDLLRDGDISANVPVMPGDIIIIPQTGL